jgi:hypothetical protein
MAASGMGVGLSIPEVAGRAPGPDPATLALVARMSATPDAARVAAIDGCVRALKRAGVWAKLHALYLIAAHEAQAAGLNWTGADHALTPVNAPAFTADRGYAGDGTSSYLDTGWAPNLGAQDSLCFGFWVLGNLQAGAGSGTGTAASVAVNPRTGADAGSYRINAAAPFSASGQSDSRGLTTVNRSAANACQAYRGGVEVASAATASVAPSAASLCLGRFNTGGYNSHQYAAAAIGASLDAGEQAALHAALAGYLAAVGAV